MTKVRIFIDSDIKSKVEIILSKSQSHYLRNVMRSKIGDEIFIFNNEKEEWIAKIINIKRLVRLLPLSFLKNHLKKNKLDIWICFGIIKSKNINYLVEKISEIGVDSFIPIKTDYSEKYKINYDRLQKIATEAVEQSEGLSIPFVQRELLLIDAINQCKDDRKIIVCDEMNDNNEIARVLNDNSFSKVAIFVGPVGGWSKKDREIFFSKKKKIFFVSLGDRLLKVDTAAIFAVSCLKSIRKLKNEK